MSKQKNIDTIMRRYLYSTLLLLLFLVLCSCNNKNNTQLLFDKASLSDSSMWEVEQSDDSKVLFSEEGMEIFDYSGTTVWLKTELEQPFTIEFDVKVVDKGGSYDRLSDMNVFWLASDPQHLDNLFYDGHGRVGQFKQYDNLQLYYVGMGAHDNTRTRYRKYDGQGNKELEERYDLQDATVLLEANKTYTIRIEAIGDRMIYARDGDVIFDIIDENPLHKGWFAFRTWRSHQLISDFKVYKH